LFDWIEISLEGGRSPWLWCLPLALAILTLWSYRRTWPPAGFRYRLLLISIRLIVVFIAAWLIFQPAVTLFSRSDRRERVAVLLDRSASMFLPASASGGPDSLSRLSRATALLHDLSNDTLSAVFTFGGSVRRLSGFENLNPSGTDVSGRTDLSAALREITAPGMPRWDRICVVSDGVVNSGEALTIPDGGFPPVDTYIPAEMPSSPDLALAALKQTRPAYEGEPVELELSVSVDIPSGSLTPEPGAALLVDFHVDGRKVSEMRLEPGAFTGRFIGGRTELPPLAEGQHVLQAVLRPLANEWTLRNNERLLLLDVARGRRAMLLVTGSTDWDFSFLRRALSSNGDWSVTALAALGGEQRSVRGIDPNGRISAGHYPDDRELGKIELAALHGDLSRLDRAFLQRLAARAARGGFALIIWPAAAFNSSLLPEGLAAYLPFAKLPASMTLLNAANLPCRLLDARRSGIAFEPGETQLPPVEFVFSSPELAPDAVVLAALSRTGTGSPSGTTGGAPLVAARERNGVRSATVLASGLWRWHMLSQDTAPEKDARYETFWQALAGWLVGGGRLTGRALRPERGVFSLGDEIVFSSSGELDEHDSLKLKLTIARHTEYPGGMLDTLVVLESPPPSPGEIRHLTVPALPPGVYRWSAAPASSETDSYGGLFAVENYSPEMAAVRPDSTSLAVLSRVSGGNRIHGDAPDGLFSERFTSQRITHRFNPARQTWLYFSLIALLAAEWVLRRRKSLA